MTWTTVGCPYCGKDCVISDGWQVYGRADLKDKVFWICKPCDARVRVHEGTCTPLGTPAKAELRKRRMYAHKLFDPMWRAKMRREGVNQKEARGAGYGWLAREMGISKDDCHIAMMDEERIEVCIGVLEKVRGITSR